MFDISDLAAANVEASKMKVVHPVKGIIEGMTITLSSPDSDRMQNLLRADVDEAVQRAKKGIMLSAHEINERGIDILVKHTVSWEGFYSGVDEAGEPKPMPCTPENVRAIYADPRYAWIKKQVNAWVSSDAHFFGD